MNLGSEKKWSHCGLNLEQKKSLNWTNRRKALRLIGKHVLANLGNWEREAKSKLTTYLFFALKKWVWVLETFAISL